jgi:hypothetical protein
MKTYVNENKDPNGLHKYLVDKNCKPLSLGHNAVYGILGEKEKEATEIYIEIDPEKEQFVDQLISDFMSQ